MDKKRGSLSTENAISSKKSGDYYYWSGQETAYISESDQVVSEMPHLYQDSYYDNELLEKEAALLADNIKYRDRSTAAWYAENDIDPIRKPADGTMEQSIALSHNEYAAQSEQSEEENNEEMMAFRVKPEGHVYSTADFGWDQSASDDFWGTRFGFWSRYNYNTAQRWYAVTGTLNRFQDSPAYFIGNRGPSFLSEFALYGTASIGGRAWAYQNLGFFASPFRNGQTCGGTSLWNLNPSLFFPGNVGNDVACMPFGTFSLMAYAGPDLYAFQKVYAPLFGYVIRNHNSVKKFGLTENEIVLLRSKDPNSRLTRRGSAELYRSDRGGLLVRNNSVTGRSGLGSLNRTGLNRNRGSGSSASGISRSTRSSSSSGSGISRNTGSGNSGISRTGRVGSSGSGSSSRGSSGSSSSGKRGGGGN